VSPLPPADDDNDVLMDEAAGDGRRWDAAHRRWFLAEDVPTQLVDELFQPINDVQVANTYA